MGIKVLHKNWFDLDYNGITTTVTDAVASNTGGDFTDLMRNRNNTSGWATTGSNDSADTEIEFNFGTSRDVDTVVFTNHNMKDYTLKYYDALLLTWVDFSTPVNVSGNTESTTSHTFTKVSPSRFKLVIDATQIANADKRISQSIFTSLLGEFECEPKVLPVVDQSRKVTKYLSGKSYVARATKAFACRLQQPRVTSDNDLTLQEKMFNSYEGFLIWLCGGTSTQFSSQREGWRKQDLYLMLPIVEYQSDWSDGYFANGMDIDLKLAEVI